MKVPKATKVTADARSWQLLTEARTMLDAPLVGWRYWAATARQPIEGRFYPGAVLIPPLEADGLDLQFISSPTIPPAYCRRPETDHAAPGEGCTCGYRIVRHLSTLVEYIRRRHPNPSLGQTCLAIVRVRGTGAAATGQQDPDDTARVERVELAGPMYLAPPLAHLASSFRSTFRVPVMTSSRVSFDSWLTKVGAASRSR
jgi:hypothetical protein